MSQADGIKTHYRGDPQQAPGRKVYSENDSNLIFVLLRLPGDIHTTTGIGLHY